MVTLANENNIRVSLSFIGQFREHEKLTEGMDEENVHINSIYFVQFNKMARHVLISLKHSSSLKLVLLLN